MATSQPRQNFHQDSEAEINKHINLQQYAYHYYQAMGFYFDRDDVALPGFSKFFLSCAEEKLATASKLKKYQNKRGGRLVNQDIKKPDVDEWGTGAEALQAALALEKHLNQALLDLHKVADGHGDKQMMDFLDEFLSEQVSCIKKLSDMLSNAKRCGPGLGEYMFDKENF